MCLFINVLGQKCVWAQLCLGTIVSWHNHVWAQMCLGTNVSGTKASGHKCVWTQAWVGTNVCGHNRVWAQSCVSTNVSGHKRVWAKSRGTSHVGPIMYGHKPVISNNLLPCGKQKILIKRLENISNKQSLNIRKEYSL